MKRLVLLLAIGCGSPIDLPPSERPTLDAPDPIAVEPPLPPIAPELPAPPAIASIEGGWIEGDPIDPCPSGDFAEAPLNGAVFYVKQGSDGDGTRGRPFGTIDEAVVAARPFWRATILVGRGTYREQVLIDFRVSIIGVCAAETILEFDPSQYGVIMYQRHGLLARVTVRAHGELYAPNLIKIFGTLDQVIIESPDAFAGWVVWPITSLTVRRSVIRGVVGFEVLGNLTIDESVIASNQGIWALRSGADIRVTRSRFESRRAIGDGVKTAGIRTERGTRVQVSGSLFQGMDAALNLIGGEVEMTDCAVRDTSIGVIAHPGSRARVARTSISNADHGALFATNAKIDLEDVVIDRSGYSGFNFGSEITANRVAITGPREYAIFLSESSTLAAADLTIDDPTPQEDNGLLVTRGATVEIDRGLVRGGGFSFLGSTLAASDLTVEGGTILMGASEVSPGPSRISLERARIADFATNALALTHGTEAVATDLTIERPSGASGDPYDDIPLFVSDSHALLERMAIAGVRGIAATIGTSDVDLIDLSIRDIDPVGSDEWGNGFWIAGGSVRMHRAEIARTRMVGIVAFGGAALDASELRIADTVSGNCTVATCPYDAAGVGGIGLSATDGSRVSLDRFEIRTSRLAGAQSVNGASLSLARGTIANNEIGIHGEQVAIDDVLFFDNRTNVDTDEAFAPLHLMFPEVVLPKDVDPDTDPLN